MPRRRNRIFLKQKSFVSKSQKELLMHTNMVLSKLTSLFAKRKMFFLQFLLVIILFATGFTVRYSAYLDYKQETYGTIYSSLGGGSDNEAFIKHGLEAVNGTLSYDRSLMYDYIFLTRIYQWFFSNYGFITGLQGVIYFLLIISSFVVLAPILLLWKLHGFTVGGVIGSLILAFNPLLSHAATGLINDTVGSLVYVSFFCVFILALKYRLLWLAILLGLLGFVETINRPFLFIHNMGGLVIFTVLALFWRYGYISGTAPQRTDKMPLWHRIRKPFSMVNRRDFLFAIAPLSVTVASHLAWEFYFHQTFGKWYLFMDYIPARLSQLKLAIFGQKETLSKVEPDLFYRDILYRPTNNVERIGNYLLFLCITAFNLLKLTIVPTYLYIATPLALLFRGSSISIKMLKQYLFFLLIAFLVITIFKDLYMTNNNYSTAPASWPAIEFVKISWLFITLLFAALTNYYVSGFVLLGIPHLLLVAIGALSYMVDRYYIPLLLWFVFVLSALIDEPIRQIFSDRNNKNSKAKRFMVLTYVCLLVFLSSFYFAPKMFAATTEFIAKARQANEERDYLRWVGSILPENSIILGGTSQNLLWLSLDTQKTVLYNSAVNSPFLIPWPAKTSQIVQFSLAEFVQDPHNLQRVSVFTLDESTETWYRRVAEFNTMASRSAYKLVHYKTNPKSKRNVYQIVAE